MVRPNWNAMDNAGPNGRGNRMPGRLPAPPQQWLQNRPQFNGAIGRGNRIPNGIGNGMPQFERPPAPPLVGPPPEWLLNPPPIGPLPPFNFIHGIRAAAHMPPQQQQPQPQIQPQQQPIEDEDEDEENGWQANGNQMNGIHPNAQNWTHPRPRMAAPAQQHRPRYDSPYLRGTPSWQYGGYLPPLQSRPQWQSRSYDNSMRYGAPDGRANRMPGRLPAPPQQWFQNQPQINAPIGSGNRMPAPPQQWLQNQPQFNAPIGSGNGMPGRLPAPPQQWFQNPPQMNAPIGRGNGMPHFGGPPAPPQQWFQNPPQSQQLAVTPSSAEQRIGRTRTRGSEDRSRESAPRRVVSPVSPANRSTPMGLPAQVPQRRVSSPRVSPRSTPRSSPRLPPQQYQMFTPQRQNRPPSQRRSLYFQPRRSNN